MALMFPEPRSVLDQFEFLFDEVYEALINGSLKRGSHNDFTDSMVKKLTWSPPRDLSLNEEALPFASSLWVFWSPDDDQYQLPATDLHSCVPNLVPGTTNSCLIKKKIIEVFRCLTFTEPFLIVQFWAPKIIEGRPLLTISDQPFGLSAIDMGLASYRVACQDYYYFLVNGEREEELGLLGRVFQRKLPEWTPNVRDYSSKEYPQLEHALRCKLQGFLALPVFEPSGECCVGVIELVMTTRKTNYDLEAREVSKALKDVDLKCPCILDQSNIQISNEGRRLAVNEILKVLRVACETHKVPLSQTWAPCRHRGAEASGGSLKNFSGFDESCLGEEACISTTDIPFFVLDARMGDFREACAKHHLQKGLGVAGRAFASKKLCFCSDITQFCSSQYPLVEHARFLGLTSCFAICLQSTHTRGDYYILEFFLPDCDMNGGGKWTLLSSLLATLKLHFQSFKVASGEELGEELSIEVIKPSLDGALVLSLESIKISQTSKPPASPDSLQNRGEMTHLDSISMEKEYDGMDNGAHKSDMGIICSQKEDTRKISKRESEKTKKSISLEVLRQHFGKRLEDAAESLSISRSTLKRICRQHGIVRWPSRKRKKDNHSLRNLKLVNESIQGDEGAFTGPLPGIVGSDQTPKQDMATHTLTLPQATANQDVGTVNVKAKYRGDIIRFELSFSSGMVELEEKVAKRLKLMIGTFSIKYLDDEGDWVSIYCDEDLHHCMDIPRSLCNSGIIRLLVELIDK